MEINDLIQEFSEITTNAGGGGIAFYQDAHLIEAIAYITTAARCFTVFVEQSKTAEKGFISGTEKEVDSIKEFLYVTREKLINFSRDVSVQEFD